jgi:DNA-directed RNA polymerase specialized sigma24 family protein
MESRQAASGNNTPNDDARRLGAEVPAADSLDVGKMSLPTLIVRCAGESERFYRGHPYDSRFAFELFRRALMDRDEAAWEYVYTHYSPLVESWVRRCGAFAGSGETGEFFVVAAFTKFWRAVTPERFVTFETVAALLHYLQLCAGSVVIDSVRAQSWAEMLPEEALPATQTPVVSPDEQALDRVSRLEFWRFIEGQLTGEAERAVVVGSFLLGMKPAEIYQECPDLFESIADVYNAKRNVLSRLARNNDLRGMMRA